MSIQLRGTVTTGLGRGAKYIGMEEYQDRFEDLLGWRPYPGTLNLKVVPEHREQLQNSIEPLKVRDVTYDGEHVSDVDVYPVNIAGVEAALLDLEITDHPDSIAEIIAPKNLRAELDLTDGDEVICKTQNE